MDQKRRRGRNSFKGQLTRCHRARHPLPKKQLRLAKGKGQSRQVRVASLRKTLPKNKSKLGL